ncbi:MAG: hypothetical protein QOI36_486, partial [Pseudonocardiales bacterium]|nr:hypothetical protein [Pseudonocardiales bacterium]
AAYLHAYLGTGHPPAPLARTQGPTRAHPGPDSRVDQGFGVARAPATGRGERLAYSCRQFRGEGG